MLSQKGNRLTFHYDAEELWIEPWGENALRVRSTKTHTMPLEDWALQEPVLRKSEITFSRNEASIVNGNIKAHITTRGKITIFNSEGKLLLEEYAPHRLDLLDPKCSSLNVEAREFPPILGGDYHLTMRFESVDAKEKIFGMANTSNRIWT